MRIDEIVSVVLNTSMVNKQRRSYATDLTFIAADLAVISFAASCHIDRHYAQKEQAAREEYTVVDTTLATCRRLKEVDAATREKLLAIVEQATNRMPTLHAFFTREKLQVLMTPKVIE